jgi:hypothetical protein
METKISKIEKALEGLFGVPYKQDSFELCTFHPTKRAGHLDCQVFSESEYEEIFSKINPEMIDRLEFDGEIFYSVYQS